MLKYLSEVHCPHMSLLTPTIPTANMFPSSTAFRMNIGAIGCCYGRNGFLYLICAYKGQPKCADAVFQEHN